MNAVKPGLLLTVFKDYLSDIDRIKKYNFERLKRYQNNAFLKLIRYAYTVPLYREKYKEAGIHPGDIRGIEDIGKLPIINREDVIRHFPLGTVAPRLKRKSVVINTSGSTRNPVSLYVDQYTLMKALIAYVRELRQYGIKWNKSRISVIANFYSRTAPTQYFSSGANPTLRPFFSLNNIQQINADDNLKDIIDRVNKFQPECIVGFPGPLRHLALLRDKGYGQDIRPRCIISSGGLIDIYEKKRIEEVFGTKVFDIYGSTEAGPVSFECEEGSSHINSDFVYLEAIDADDNIIEKGKSGKLAITRLYGRGTPLIRYTGMGDVITLKDGMCRCGLETELIERVHGRIKESIVLPNQKVIFPDILADIPGRVMGKLKTDKIDRLQLVQKALDKIDVLVIINEVRRTVGPSIDELFHELKAEYEHLFGPAVEVNVKEVTKLVSEDGSEDSTPGIIPKINASKYI
jgi:phenylacetate-CoA ligase